MNVHNAHQKGNLLAKIQRVWAIYIAGTIKSCQALLITTIVNIARSWLILAHNGRVHWQIIMGLSCTLFELSCIDTGYECSQFYHENLYL